METEQEIKIRSMLNDIKGLCRMLFKIDGRPAEISDYQEEIIQEILFKLHPKLLVWAPTQSGKCGRYTLVLANGALVKVKDIEVGDVVLSLCDDWKITTNKVIDTIVSGVKPTYRVTTGTGREIVVTMDHRFLSSSGWLGLQSLSVGELIAIPRTLPVVPRKTFDKNLLKIMAYLIGDGSITQDHYGFTNFNPLLVNDLSCALPDELELVEWRRGTFGISLKEKDPKKRWGNNHLIKWFKEIGLHGANSHTKKIPEFVFQLKNDHIALFINRLFACDGWASVDKYMGCEIGYCSVSKTLIKQIQHLLLRFGILSRFNKKKARCNGKLFYAYQLTLMGSDSHSTFAREINIFGKERNIELVLNTQVSRGGPRQQHDVIPRSLFSKHIIADQRRIGFTANTKSKNIGRLNSLKFAEITGSDSDNKLATSDVFWDRIKKIEYIGEEETWDLTVENDHNFIADDIFVHNSQGIAFATILVAMFRKHEEIVYVAPTRQTGTIFEKVSGHLFDSPLITSRLQTYSEEKKDKLLGRLNREKISFIDDVTIKLLSAESGKPAGEGLLSHTATILIIDESPSVEDTTYRNKIPRMLGSKKPVQKMMIDIGTCHRRGHFTQAWEKADNDPKVKKIFVDWQRAVKEGRLDYDFVMGQKAAMTKDEFGIWYECKLPDKIGNEPIPWSKIDEAVERKFDFTGKRFLGIDPAYLGDDNTAFVDVLMGDHVEIKEILTFPKMKTTETVAEAMRLDDERHFSGIKIDYGSGQGIVDQLNEKEGMKGRVQGYYFNQKAMGGGKKDEETNRMMFYNLKAQMYERIILLFEKGRISIPHDGALIRQLREINMDRSSGRLQIKNTGSASADELSALVLACWEPPVRKKAEFFPPLSA